MSQQNPFAYAADNKRYHTWNYHLRGEFGHKVFKIALDGGFDCPNRDGTVAHGGCTFCSAAGSGDFAGNRVDSLEKQFNDIKGKMHEKWKDGKYMAYFQAYTNTHAPKLVMSFIRTFGVRGMAAKLLLKLFLMDFLRFS